MMESIDLLNDPVFSTSVEAEVQSANLDLLLHLLHSLHQLCVVLVQEVHLQLQVIQLSLHLLLQARSLSATFHLHIQTGLQGL